MNRIRFGIIAGLIFGTLDVIPMLSMSLPNQTLAISGAFISRFTIGLLIPTSTFPTSAWLRGSFLGILLSLPDAIIIAGSTVPILGSGLVGGLVIGYILGRIEKGSKSSENAKVNF